MNKQKTKTPKATIEMPSLYRADLLRNAKDATEDPNENSFRSMVEKTGLSAVTIMAALDGKAPKLDTVKILANYFGIPWLSLFDVDAVLEFDKRGRVVGFKKRRNPPTF